MSFSEWKTVKLFDVVDILGDGLHGTPNYDPEGDYYFINGNNLNGKIVVSAESKRVNRDEFLKHKKELNSRTILVSINGTLGNVALYNGEKVVLGKSACYFNVNENISKQFVKYVMLSNHFKEYMKSHATGTTIKNMGLKSMREFNFSLPPLTEQQQIASILSTLDDKIELNNRMNKVLEQMAQAIFKQWFVEFEFPNENGEPYKSSGGEMVDSELGMIPKGWKVNELGEIVNFQNGNAFKSSELLDKDIGQCYRVFKMGHINKGGGLDKSGTKSYFERSKSFNLSRYVIKKNDLLMCMTDMKANVALLGCTALMDENDKYILNQRVGLIRTKDSEVINFPFLYILTNSPMFIDNLRSRANSGVQVNLSTMEIKASKIIVPSLMVHKKFDNLTSNIYEKIFTLGKMNEYLSNLRDTLLPKLMSGELDVSNIEL